MKMNFKTTVAVVGMLLPMSAQNFAFALERGSNLDKAKVMATNLASGVASDAKATLKDVVETYAPGTPLQGNEDTGIMLAEFGVAATLGRIAPKYDKKRIKAVTKELELTNKQLSTQEIADKIESIKKNPENREIVIDKNNDGVISRQERFEMEIKPEVKEAIANAEKNIEVLNQSVASSELTIARNNQEVLDAESRINEIERDLKNYDNAKAVDSNMDGIVSNEEKNIGKLKEKPAAERDMLRNTQASLKANSEAAKQSILDAKAKVVTLSREVDNAFANVNNFNSSRLKAAAAEEISMLKLDLERTERPVLTSAQKAEKIAGLESTLKKITLKGFSGIAARGARLVMRGTAYLLVIDGFGRGYLALVLQRSAGGFDKIPVIYIPNFVCDESQRCSEIKHTTGDVLGAIKDTAVEASVAAYDASVNLINEMRK